MHLMSISSDFLLFFVHFVFELGAHIGESNGCALGKRIIIAVVCQRGCRDVSDLIAADSTGSRQVYVIVEDNAAIQQHVGQTVRH